MVIKHWGRVTHICIDNLTIIDSDNALSPGGRQAIIWTNAGIVLIGSLGTNFSEISIEIITFSVKKMRLKVPSAKRGPFCLGLNASIHMKRVVLLESMELLNNITEKLLLVRFRRNYARTIIFQTDTTKSGWYRWIIPINTLRPPTK